MHVTITSAQPLTSTQLEVLKKAVEKKHGKKNTFSEIVDESVIGGVRVVVGSTQYDGTVRHQLDQIRSTTLKEI